jgi:hypothetical protein
MLARSATCGAILILLCGPDILAAQQQLHVPERTACSTCRIVLTPVVELGNDHGEPGAIGSVMRAARNSLGHTFVVYSHAQYQIVQHDPAGAVVRRIGRKGMGPGEFQAISDLRFTDGDTLHVFDQMQLRRIVLAPDGTLVRTNPVPGSPIFGIPLGQERVVIASNIRTREAAGFPLHVVDTEGHITESFGSELPLLRPDLPYLLLRTLSPVNDSVFWVGHVNRYRLERFGPSGLEVVIQSRPSWFAPYDRTRPVSPESPPESYLSAHREDESGRLWIIVQVPGRTWRDALEPYTTESGMAGFRVRNPAGYRDSMIQVVDPTTGDLLATARYPHVLGGFVDPGHVLSFDTDDLGRSYIRVYRVRLDERAIENE